ncbi:nickel pincer cofactor biosynthesis protein LarB [Legionella taurinensis]|uniref:nickel pincer cofactor biosynthesis protein LarB n=1 Tax=Legionella taurinensis TaxID=70611 RepID=UPI000D3CC1AA|nr:nickel pincer cofactor biosynthesis protein LarB [Legionella taurinensis]PUT44358.1 nickel pincer cofactor biosynthesis protein LarB [Legionella taurinensis]TID33698.1 nickel pincer cofactor biosynthesis protein LarB [Legionella taurinensis]TID34542.1 nickel pincer cofactor biosynthesis protein LarB [Legionella taurinensis]
MNECELELMLTDLIAGEINISQTINQLKNTLLRHTTLDYAQPDHHRQLRHGLNEVIYGQGKSSEQIIEIAKHLSLHKSCVLITRLDADKINDLTLAFPEGRINEQAGTFTVYPPAVAPLDLEKQFVAIVSAGTSDLRVAEEAKEVCIAMNIATACLYDVGVCGLQRVLSSLDTLQKASVVIVVAGMEGALPSVVGGLVGMPVIAVPTSVGYGASFNGVSALLGMLNSCAPGLVVTNIDAGFAAGFAAARIINGMNKRENTVS